MRFDRDRDGLGDECAQARPEVVGHHPLREEEETERRGGGLPIVFIHRSPARTTTVLRSKALVSKDSVGAVHDIGHGGAPDLVETLPHRTKPLTLYLPEQECDEIVFPRGQALGEEAAELLQPADGQMVRQRVFQCRDPPDVDVRPHGWPSGVRSAEKTLRDTDRRFIEFAPPLVATRVSSPPSHSVAPGCGGVLLRKTTAARSWRAWTEGRPRE